MIVIRTLLAFVVLLGYAVASPQRGPCRDNFQCVDGYNDCGEYYGGCYNTCSPQDSPTPAPCKTTEKPEPPTSTTDNCSTRTTCMDGINGCGEQYTTCIPDCFPWEVTPPPCGGETTPTITSKPEKPTSTKKCQHMTLCEDYIDQCGQTYGGCYDTCSPSPTWPRPSCSRTSKPTSKPTH